MSGIGGRWFGRMKLSLGLGVERMMEGELGEEQLALGPKTF